jgi:hypothetical protein
MVGPLHNPGSFCFFPLEVKGKFVGVRDLPGLFVGLSGGRQEMHASSGIEGRIFLQMASCDEEV